jgi:hypothetical protein
MTVAHVTDGGALETVAVVSTAVGARNPIVDARGKAYVEDALGGRLLVIDLALAGRPAPAPRAVPAPAR